MHLKHHIGLALLLIALLVVTPFLAVAAGSLEFLRVLTAWPLEQWAKRPRLLTGRLP